ncbi:pantetheine-phosphate adenylyltransferase [Pelagibacterium montanilacus]|uniref:pantetheine-phosphate adenylyltransferase n=1 Tax=Pelagibacterium montanilacus TaxID=2185280 RepID=UPI000F8E4B14|nr:pantetheine-phosphate adenylyltransferase [Pelagibacterium montanilacus]
MKMRIGFYPGSFDPLTNGHVDIIDRACGLVDRLVIGVGVHAQKSPMLAAAERVRMIDEITGPIAAGHETEVAIMEFDGLMVDAALASGAGIVIRGLRDTTDYNYEMQMVGMNARLAPDLQTVFLPSSPAVRHISATLVRQIAGMGGDISHFVPARVLELMEM